MRLPMVGALVLLAGCTAPPAESTTGTGTVAIPAPGPATTSGPTSGAQGGDTLGLHRPLVLPTLAAGSPCPVSLTRRQPDPALGPIQGTGPAGPAGLGPDGSLTFVAPGTGGVWTDRSWGGMKVLWAVDPTVSGSVLVRPRQLDGAHPVGFDDPVTDELVLDPRGPVDTGRVARLPRLHPAAGSGLLRLPGGHRRGTSVIIFRAVGPTIAE